MKPPLPQIERDAFLNSTATAILRPEEGPFNDHCFARDSQGRWHFLDGRHAIGGDHICEPMKLQGWLPGIRDDKRIADFWAPCAVVKNDTLHVFFTDTVVALSQGWRSFVEYVRSGNPFKMWRAEAPLSDFSQLQVEDMLFEDIGGARDPFVFWHNGIAKWVMLYCKRIDPGQGEVGESGVAYRLSDDLLHWSDLQGYVTRGFRYEDEMRDSVTEAIGNAESPQLVEHAGWFYLFVTHVGYKKYHQTKVWASADPLKFAHAETPLTVIHAHAPEIIVEDDGWFITNCGIHHREFGETGLTARIRGIEVAPLLWPDRE